MIFELLQAEVEHDVPGELIAVFQHINNSVLLLFLALHDSFQEVDAQPEGMTLLILSNDLR